MGHFFVDLDMLNMFAVSTYHLSLIVFGIKDEKYDRKVVVYANTSAAVKARADWVVTSGSALKWSNTCTSVERKSSGHLTNI